jgi:lipopolysaccharide export system permease protein
MQAPHRAVSRRGRRPSLRLAAPLPGRLLDRYVFGLLFEQVCLVLVVLVAIFAFFAVLEQLEDVGAGRYHLGFALLLAAYQIPTLMQQLAPIAALIGALVCVGGLVASNEITAMRAAGVGLRRVVTAAVLSALCFGTLALVVSDLTVPPSQRAERQLKAQVRGEDDTLQLRSGYWARDGMRFINIRGVRPDGEVTGVTIHEFDAEDRLRLRTEAASARWVDGQWELSDVRQRVLDDDRVESRALPAALWASPLRPDLIDMVTVEPEGLSMRDLHTYASFLERNAQDSQRYRQALAAKYVYPLASAAMVLLAIPLVFTTPRDAGMGLRLPLGVLIGLVFHVANQAASDVGVVYGLPPLVAALGPSLTAIVAALLLFRRMR